MQENSLEPLAQPEIEVTKFEDNEALEFTAEVDVKPDFELPAYDALEAEVEDIELSATPRSRSRSRRCVSASAPSSTSSARPPTATS